MLPLEVWQDGDAVVELKGIGVCSIVDQDNILHGPIQYSQVFDEVTLLGDIAMLPIKAVLNKVLLGVEVI